MHKDYAGKNIIVLHAMIEHSPDDLPSGWDDKRALGLSAGGYYSYRNDIVHWFTKESLHDTITNLINQQPIIISFNGWKFDSVLMAEACFSDNKDIPREWPTLWGEGYDILDEIWRVLGAHRKGHTLNKLLAMNGLKPLERSIVDVPKLWQEGSSDVYKVLTHSIFAIRDLAEAIHDRNGWVDRPAGPLHIRHLCEHMNAVKECTGYVETHVL